METKNKPVARYTAYPVEAAVWENERVADGRRTVGHAVTVASTYKDASGALKSARSFRVDELPSVLYVLARAYAALLDLRLGQEQPEGGEA